MIIMIVNVGFRGAADPAQAALVRRTPLARALIAVGLPIGPCCHIDLQAGLPFQACPNPKKKYLFRILEYERKCGETVGLGA